MENSIERRASRIKLLLMDCDGVLTDGRLLLLENGDEQKWFSARDGLGLELWRRAGLKSGIISGRNSKAVERRARELKMDFVRQGSEDKIAKFDELLRLAGVGDEQVAFIGDDLNDIPLMRRSELAIAVADAAPEAQQAAHYITSARGGYGAVREAVELILRAQGYWSDLLEKYLKG
ncbi:MAG TPA: HAD hydrolase family protein [Pyrinomonadaceae bacterium]|nr:HAD hydrolase family protein [Pyrinomonadaceae bacterium]